MRAVLRLRFTLLLAGAIVAVAAWQGTLTGALPAEVEYNWGFGLHSIREGRAWTVLTGAFLTSSGWMVLAQMAMLAYSVAVCERRLGWRRTAWWFWVSNVAAHWLTALAVVAPLAWLGWTKALHAAATSDTGASAGGVGCFSAWVQYLPERRRRAVWWAAAALLVGKMLLWPSLQVDGAHLLGFLVGGCLARRAMGGGEGAG